MNNAIFQKQSQTQSLLLTDEMKQSLNILRMSVTELCAFVQSKMISNPLLDIEYPIEVPLGSFRETEEISCSITEYDMPDYCDTIVKIDADWNNGFNDEYNNKAGYNENLAVLEDNEETLASDLEFQLCSIRNLNNTIK